MSDGSEKGGFYSKENLTLEGVRNLGVELKRGKIFVVLTIDLLALDSGDAGRPMHRKIAWMQWGDPWDIV